MVQPIEQYGRGFYSAGASVRWRRILQRERSAGERGWAWRSERGVDRVAKRKHGVVGAFERRRSKLFFAEDREFATTGEQSSANWRGQCRDWRGFLRRFAGGLVRR